MLIKYTTKLSKENVNGFSQEISNNLEGGNDKKFDLDTNFNPANDLKNNFSVKDFQTYCFELENGNTFNSDILDFIKSDYEDITFVQVACHNSSDDSKIPIRFNVSLKINGNATVFSLGSLSIFTLGNLKDNLVDGIFINNILVPSEKSAFLTISIGTKSKNNS